MIRRGHYKYISCITDPDQLFDLKLDPNECHNLATETPGEMLDAFRREASEYWDARALQQTVIADQQRRREVHAALRIGRYQSWDFNPARNASEEYTRSHMDLTRFDITSRYPRPVPFKPDSK